MYTFHAILAFASIAAAQQTLYGQCGGTGWTGDTTCAQGATCIELNPYYSQCQPGVAPTTIAPSSISATTAPAPTAQSTPPATTTVPSTGTGSTTGPGTTLQSGYFWVRAVEDPNFHKYLQTTPEYAPGTAILSDPSTAGQFNIVDGQLVELIDTKGTLLYANVGMQMNASETYLPVTFSTTKNTYGSFGLEGDALTWSVPSINRPQLTAWYVCTGQQLFINLGNYEYMTPPQCADETIHSYGGSTATA